MKKIFTFILLLVITISSVAEVSTFRAVEDSKESVTVYEEGNSTKISFSTRRSSKNPYLKLEKLSETKSENVELPYKKEDMFHGDDAMRSSRNAGMNVISVEDLATNYSPKTAETTQETTTQEATTQETTTQEATTDNTSQQEETQEVQQDENIGETINNDVDETTQDETTQDETTQDETNADNTVQEETTTESTTISTPVYYLVDSNGELSSASLRMPRASSNETVITVEDGKIVDISSGIAMLIGGYDKMIYGYPTVEDAYNKSNAIPLNGGGYDATFFETVEYQGNRYVKIAMSGFVGYLPIYDVQLIPENLVQAQSFYRNENGLWVYYSAIDALMSGTYERMIVGQAPEWAKVDVKYYTNDDETFYESPESLGAVGNSKLRTTATTTSYTYNAYFQNLPFRSESSYTASQLKSFLGYMGKSKSEYYNATGSFVDAENKEFVNSLMLMAMANLEAAYGTSYFSRACNNFFGRGAFDSNPDNACISFGYPTPRDGILAQAIFLNNQYFDSVYWPYAGTHVGNKSHGMNVYYATDPDWGKKISAHANSIDSYLGGKENRLYTIVASTSRSNRFYRTSTLDSGLAIYNYAGTRSTYYATPGAGSRSTHVATSIGSGKYKVILPTQLNISSSTRCNYTLANKGSYPNYDGTDRETVPIGSASYACSYSSWDKQQAWISGKNTTRLYTGSYSQSLSEICNILVSTYKNSNGETVRRYTSESGFKVCTLTYNKTNNRVKSRYYYYYDNFKRLIKRRTIKYRTSGVKYYYADTNYSATTKYIKNYNEYSYDTKGKRIRRNEKIYYSNGKASRYKRSFYNSSYKLYRAYVINYDTRGRKEDYLNVYYSTSTGKRTSYKHYFYNTSGTRIQRNEATYRSGRLYSVTSYYYSSNGTYLYKTTKYY